MKKGFTLVELAIVLVIIGLLVGGIIGGQELVKRATLNKTIDDYKILERAYQTFKLKYNCLPGDCANITAFLGGPCPGLLIYTTDSATCNGNDNKLIDNYEERFVCQQLRLAGFIKSSCQGGLGDSPPLGVQGGVNAYKSSYKDGRILDITVITKSSGSYWDHFKTTNYISMYSDSVGGTYTPNSVFYNASMKPSDSEFLDKKVDDGKPMTGKVLQLDYVGCLVNASNTYNMAFDTSYFCSTAYELGE